MDAKQKAEELLLQLIDKSTQAGDFIAEQTPIVIQELLTYNFAVSLFFFVFWLSVSCCAWTAYYKFIAWGRKPYKQDSSYSNIYKLDLEGFVIIVPAALIPTTPIFLLCTDWVKIWLAPRVYLIEYAASLVK